MEYRLGNSKKIKQKGDTAEIKCPKCGKLGQFGIFSNLDTRLIPCFPLVNVDTVYFAVCPNCASIFGTDKDSYKAFTKGDMSAINTDKLFDLLEFNVNE